MKKHIIFLFQGILLLLPGSAAAQTESICKIYGRIQGVSYDFFKKQCSEKASSEACQDLLTELSRGLDVAVGSREEYVEVNTQGCIIVLQKVQNGIAVSVEAYSQTKAFMYEVYQRLAEFSFTRQPCP